MDEKTQIAQPAYNPYPQQAQPGYSGPQSSQASAYPTQPPPYTSTADPQYEKVPQNPQEYTSAQQGPMAAGPMVHQGAPPCYAAPPPGYVAPPGYIAPNAGYMPPPGAPIYASGAPITVIHSLALGSTPVQCACPKCNQTIITSTTSYAGSIIWLICLFIILFGGWVFCLCFIPFCIEDLKDVRHSCPNCKHTIGVYKRHF